jgi:hypothetical protein
MSNAENIAKLSKALNKREIILHTNEGTVIALLLGIIADQETRLTALEKSRDPITPEVRAVVEAAPEEARPGTPEAVVHLTGTVEG